MTPQEAEALAHRWHTAFADVVVGTVVHPCNPAVINEILTTDFVVHWNGEEMRGSEQANQLATIQRTAFPDGRITHHETIVVGDRVAVRWTTEATHQGALDNIPPTGKPIHCEGLDLFHLRDGEIAELWIAFDNLRILQQIGVIPAPGQATQEAGV
jgi:predicted ester cyclase